MEPILNVEKYEYEIILKTGKNFYITKETAKKIVYAIQYELKYIFFDDLQFVKISEIVVIKAINSNFVLI